MRKQKRRGGRPRQVKPNPYAPMLLTMHQSWNPVQIAGAISGLEDELMAEGKLGEFEFSERLVLRLSKLHQQPESGNVSRLVDAGPFGICGTCNMKRADLIVEDGPGSVLAICNGCYGMTIGDVARPRPIRERGERDGGNEQAKGDDAPDSAEPDRQPEQGDRGPDGNEPDPG